MRRTVAIGVTMGFALLAPAPAIAALTVTEEQTEEVGTRLLAQDPSGVPNVVKVGVGVDPGQYLFSDESGITSLPPACTRVGPNGGRCPLAMYAQMVVETGGGDDTVSISGSGHVVGPNQPFRLPVDLGEGGDLFYATGTFGHNLVKGGSGGDRFFGGLSGDFFFGLGGRDGMVGADGDDLLVGGPGRDRMRGSGGRDVLNGRAGNDYLSLGPGKKELALGGRGKDTCVGKVGDRAGGCEKIRPLR